MPSRQPVTVDLIGNAAYSLVVAGGLESLSMRSIAEKLGIKAPSLYKHISNREQIVALVQAKGMREFGEWFLAAGPTTRDKVLAYRSWAYSNPHLYYVVMREPLQREHLPPGTEEHVLMAVVEAAGGNHENARAMWSLLHGLIDLEFQHRYPPGADLDSTWNHAVKLIEGSRSAH